MGHIPPIWSCFSQGQKHNIILYIWGIMMYKFGLEYFNGAFMTMANERFEPRDRYQKMAILTGLNYATQGLGSIIISPLVKHCPTRSVLSIGSVLFALVSAGVLVIDAVTGGAIKFNTPNNETKYGNWDPNLLFPIFTLAGLSYGMVELIRKEIPRDIVGGDVDLLKRMDAVVHVFYEVAGTVAALTSTGLISKLGYNYSSILSPVLFSAAAMIWFFIDPERIALQEEDERRSATTSDTFDRGEKVTNGGQTQASVTSVATKDYEMPILESWIAGFRSFVKAFYYGAWLCCTHRKFIWLVPSYALSLYAHRYLENGLIPMYSKLVLDNSSYAQIIVGGSNAGELLGALSVMLALHIFPTPIPWLRLDALLINLVWVIPFFPVARGHASSAWKLAPCLIPISYGWAGGDCSLSAHIQAILARIEAKEEDVSSLGAVMAFLYVMYLVAYSIISTLLGRYVDTRLNQLGSSASVEATAEAARSALKYIGGVQFTLIGVMIVAATFIPKGSRQWNPFELDGQRFGRHETTADEEEEQSKKAREAEEEKTIQLLMPV